jgi:hypothetical protein
MKLIHAVTLSAVFSFFLGCLFEHSRSGYNLKVLETQKFDSAYGPVTWTAVKETVGVSFLDTGKTKIEFDGREIYKAQRGFQESVPYARVLKVSGSSIEWTDGDYRYFLDIQKEKANQGH